MIKYAEDAFVNIQAATGVDRLRKPGLFLSELVRQNIAEKEGERFFSVSVKPAVLNSL